MSNINTEIEKIADKIEKSTIDYDEKLIETIKQLGSSGLRKAMETLSEKDLIVLKSTIESMKKAVNQPKVPAAKPVEGKLSDTKIQEDKADDDEDEKVVDNKNKTVNAQGDTSPEGREGQVIKACGKVNKGDVKVEDDEVEMDKKEFVKEHKKLSSVLKEGSDKEQAKEGKKQEKELKDVQKSKSMTYDPELKGKEDLKKKRGVPKGVDPAKHERCVKEVKKQPGVNPYAVCTAAMKKSEVDEIVEKAWQDRAARAMVSTAKKEGLVGDKKKGEGARGGNVIGHTRSGKPIYSKFGHVAHKDFSPKDHHDASEIHMKRQIKESGDITVKNTKDGSKHKKIAVDTMKHDEHAKDVPKAHAHATKQVKEPKMKKSREELLELKEKVIKSLKNDGVEITDDLVKGKMKELLMDEIINNEKPQGSTDKKPEIQKSIPWDPSYKPFKANTLGRNHNFSVNGYYDELIKAVNEENSKEDLKKSEDKTDEKEDVKGLIKSEAEIVEDLKKALFKDPKVVESVAVSERPETKADTRREIKWKLNDIKSFKELRWCVEGLIDEDKKFEGLKDILETEYKKIKSELDALMKKHASLKKSDINDIIEKSEDSTATNLRTEQLLKANKEKIDGKTDKSFQDDDMIKALGISKEDAKKVLGD